MPQRPRRAITSCRSVAVALLFLFLAPLSATAQTDEPATPETSAEAAPERPQLEALIARRQAEEERAVEIGRELEALEATALPSEATTDASEPVTLPEFEALEAELANAGSDLESADRAVSVALNALQAADGAKSESAEPGDLLARIDEERLALRRATLEAARFEKKAAERRFELAQAATNAMSGRVRVSVADRAGATARFDTREASLRRRIERAELARREAETRWKAVQSRADANTSPSRLAAARAELSLHRKAVVLLSAELERVAPTRLAVERRLDALSGRAQERQVALDWLKQARAATSGFEGELRLTQADSNTLEQEIANLPVEQAKAPRAAALESRLAMVLAAEADLQGAITEQRRLTDTLEQATGSSTLRDRFDDLVQFADRAWNYEIGTTGDQVITVGKIALALLLMVVGLIASRVVSRTVERRVFPRFGLDDGASHAFAELAFYALVVVVFLLSLQSVSIPITAFAVLGGALAIGVGFGSQNVVNNFISGIILLAERPIKIGDLVQVDETYGNIERIGLRSTRVRTGENIHVIVPNSTFLETKVVNWTHHDTQVRISISVGVAYGSPTREVESCIRAAIDGVPEVLKSPEPIVLFTEFGDNALTFEALFWARVRALIERRKLESQVRFAVDDQFREAGITIAFPQRDVHLDSLSPIEVKVVGGSPVAEREV